MRSISLSSHAGPVALRAMHIRIWINVRKQMCMDQEIGTMGNRCGKTGGQSSSTLIRISCLREGERKKDNMLSRIVLSKFGPIGGLYNGGNTIYHLSFVVGWIASRMSLGRYYLRRYRQSSGWSLGSGSWVGDTAHLSLAVPSSLCLALPSSIGLRRRLDCISDESRPLLPSSVLSLNGLFSWTEDQEYWYYFRYRFLGC